MTSIFYPYRVFLASGHSFEAYRHEDDELKVWESIKGLRKDDEGFRYFFFDKPGNTISGVIDPTIIVGVDRPFGIKPVDLEERKKLMEQAREKASAPNGKTNVGSVAIDITKRK